MSREAPFQAELYRILRNVIGSGFSVDGLVFEGVDFERPVNSGRADLVVLCSGKPFIVIETKKERAGRFSREIDPLSPDVIGQAAGYALMLGAPYFITANPEFIASFTLPARRGEKLDITRHRIKFWSLKDISENFARELLETIARYHLATEDGRVKLRTPLDWAFIFRLRSFVSWLYKLAGPAFKEWFEIDRELRKKIEGYFEDRGVKFNPLQFAKEACYIFMNKIVFYKILERHNSELPKLSPIQEYDPRRFIERLQEFFDKAVEVTGDFEAIFKTDIYDHMILPEDSSSLADIIDGINAFIEDMDYYRLEDFEADIVGHVYEELIDPQERHQLGQFYTPPAIAELITKWCIRSSDDKVLDPAVGSGTFLVKAYSRLKNLKLLETPRRSDRVIHREIISQLYAIDIDSFPAHLTAINLAMRDVREPITEINVIPEDFFKVAPEQMILTGYKVRTIRGEVRREITIPKVDVIIANPPYTRWIEIPDKTKEAIQEVLKDVLKQYNLTARVQQGIEPGIYIHFIMHAGKFLRPSGRLGMIISDSWLQTDYGVDFGRYLLENWKVKAIIDISARVFPVPLIGTCIILLEKPSNGEDVKDNEVIFMYLDIPEGGSFDVEGILKALENLDEARETFLIRTYKQGDIPRDQKWINLIFSSEEVISKLREKTIPASEIFEISRGNSIWSTWAMKHGRRPDLGAKNFFYFNEDKVKQWGVEEYVYPAITSARYVPNFVFNKDDWEELKNRGADCYLFVCHRPRSKLPKSVREYIEWGETRCRTQIRGTRGGGIPCHQALACQERERQKQYFYGWYDLGGIENAPILAIRQSRYKTRFILNEFNAITYDAIIAYIPTRPISKLKLKALLGYLNSSFIQLYIESTGRTTGAVGPIALEVRHAEEMPIIDVDDLDEDELKDLADLFDKLDSEARKLGGAEKRENIMKIWDTVISEIDYKVAQILGLPKELADGARALAKIMMERRLQRAKEARPQAIRGEEEYKVKRLPRTRAKRSRIIGEDKRQTRLDGVIS
ncbi:MAG: N-6 DNA methylase [Nitrososphaeria archaeon]|nr:N-6 DNA methylase [Nitrososphaeria archaeon]MDW7987009.1 N-6 DNA methylase [Nitrososphaerota archaeon]